MVATLTSPKKLSGLQQDALFRLLGKRYEYGVRGRANDGVVGLVREDIPGVAIMDVLYETDELDWLDHNASVYLDSQSRGQVLRYNGRWLFDAPVLRDVFQRIDQQKGDDIEVLHGTASAAEVHMRERTFSHIFEQLTPELSQQIAYLDYHRRNDRGDVRGIALSVMGAIHLFVKDYCGRIMLHEIAHLRTNYLELVEPDFTRRWKSLAGPVYRGTRVRHGVLTANDRRHGLISHYARSSWKEDVSELVSYCYLAPAVVKEVLLRSPLVRGKVHLLYLYGYLRKDQYDYLVFDGSQPPSLLPGCEKKLSPSSFWDFASIPFLNGGAVSRPSDFNGLWGRTKDISLEVNSER